MIMRSGFLLGVLMIALLLQGCGRKGPLRLPDKQVQAHAIPATPEVQNTDAGQTDAQKSDSLSTQPASQP